MLPARRIVVLTGAGISAESGVPTFRGPGGLWNQRRIEDLATPEAFRRDPVLVHAFYNERRARLLSGAVQPNAAHAALARLQAEFAGELLLVTQNVDDLHERAGSHAVVHMHGELLKLRCARSGRVMTASADVSVADCCACCGVPGRLRPHVVWFGEVPLHMERIEAALARCELFVAIGTSGKVYPAAGFAQRARLAGARTLELNLEATGGCFDEARQGAATQLVPVFVKDVLQAARE